MATVTRAVLVEEWLEKDPDNARLLAELAHFRFELEEFDKAVELLEHANRLKPAAANYLNLGAARAMLGDFEKAAEALEKARAMAPDRAFAHYRLAGAYRHLGRMEEAEKSYKEAIRLEPGSADAHHDLGRLYLEMGKRELAQEEYEHLKASGSPLAEKLLEAINRN
jgi:tetratricopeptide (TPR) repeat protein